MKGKKNLEKAIVLGLMLSSIAAPVWAEQLTGNYTPDGNGNPKPDGTVITDEEKIFDEIDIKMSGTSGYRTTILLAAKNGAKISTEEGTKKVSIINTSGSSYLSHYGTTNNNDAVFAYGGSTIDLKADEVYIAAIGELDGTFGAKFTTDNAISAKNTDHSNAGDNTINISGGTVQIIGDVDFSGSTKDGKDIVNLNLNGANSYWYGNVKGADEDNIANIALSNGAEWIYRYHGKLDLDVTLGGTTYNIQNDGNHLQNLALNGGIVNLDDNEIKNIYANTVIKNGQEEYRLEDYFTGLNADLTENVDASDFLGKLELAAVLGKVSEEVNHQSVEIENLTGKGGIFKLNLDWETNQGEKSYTDNSDYVFIENSESDSTQAIAFDASKANLDKMNVGDKLYFANVEDGNTKFTTIMGDNAVYSKVDSIYNYQYGVGSETGNGTDWYIGLTGKSAEGNANYESAKGAMYAGYVLGTELDTLNKRMGEARYLEDDNGVWVRYRHAKTGWDDTFETNSNMFQLGFDNEVQEDDGTHYRGVAVDYTDADTSLMHARGDGEIKRYAVSLYDTWVGEKGHYRDLVLRGGRINSDYDISGMFSNGMEDIGGDYHQWFGSISAEWGRKNAMQSGWYFEPQTQLQLARVGGASYVSDSSIAVDQDGATSLIGRVGFRLGREYEKDNGKTDNYYFKADLMHEFMGDKGIALSTATERYTDEYDGQETWFDIGLGADISIGKNSFFWADVERTLGADFDNTWQVNGGFRWEF